MIWWFDISPLLRTLEINHRWRTQPISRPSEAIRNGDFPSHWAHLFLWNYVGRSKQSQLIKSCVWKSWRYKNESSLWIRGVSGLSLKDITININEINEYMMLTCRLEPKTYDLYTIILINLDISIETQFIWDLKSYEYMCTTGISDAS